MSSSLQAMRYFGCLVFGQSEIWSSTAGPLVVTTCAFSPLASVTRSVGWASACAWLIDCVDDTSSGSSTPKSLFDLSASCLSRHTPKSKELWANDATAPNDNVVAIASTTTVRVLRMLLHSLVGTARGGPHVRHPPCTEATQRLCELASSSTCPSRDIARRLNRHATARLRGGERDRTSVSGGLRARCVAQLVRAGLR